MNNSWVSARQIYRQFFGEHKHAGTTTAFSYHFGRDIFTGIFRIPPGVRPVPVRVLTRPSYPRGPQAAQLAGAPDPRNTQQTAWHNRELSIRSGAERLYQLSGELLDELKTAPAGSILNARMYKRVQEIERLAK